MSIFLPRRAPWALLSGLVLATLCGCDEDDAAGHAVKPAQRAAQTPPSAAVENLLTVDAAQLQQRIRSSGKRGALVNVWASWCGSCRDEIPMLLQMRDALAREGLDFLFVSADEPAAFASAVEQMRALHGPLPTLAVAGSMRAFRDALRPDWRGAIPATFLFDATAKLRYFWEGPIYEHEITPILQGFLAGEPIDGATRPALRGGPAR
jgi:thiol-disulfide isomerase/thioredoxin